ncbi:MAG: heavy-metal-associated domain-containing protein [Candidatus Thermoplasmatota archaeon]|jgi:copper chaperone CopZ|nr:heavy-metal-associated domain-containing protein [Candidatus Thermoplasmatota archaeon]MCL5789376.1 heavy-metal-associated domain-containing protein [Candidatus Thermoplasmatota archaeon]
MEEKRATIRVYGMTCDDCVEKISQELKKQEGVISAYVSLNEGTGSVTIDPDKVKPEDLLKNPIFSKGSHYRAILLDQ